MKHGTAVNTVISFLLFSSMEIRNSGIFVLIVSVNEYLCAKIYVILLISVLCAKVKTETSQCMQETDYVAQAVTQSIYEFAKLQHWKFCLPANPRQVGVLQLLKSLQGRVVLFGFHLF